jgi:hypothetical protein
MRSSNSEIYAVASRDEAKLKECRKKFNNPKSYSGYAELLDDPDIDAIIHNREPFFSFEETRRNMKIIEELYALVR